MLKYYSISLNIGFMDYFNSLSIKFAKTTYLWCGLCKGEKNKPDI